MALAILFALLVLGLLGLWLRMRLRRHMRLIGRRSCTRTRMVVMIMGLGIIGDSVCLLTALALWMFYSYSVETEGFMFVDTCSGLFDI